MSSAFELDLRPTASAELFPALYQAYLKLKPGTRLRAIVDKNPRQSYMGFVEAGIPHRIARLGDGEWEWSATRTAWEPMGNGPGVHHVGMSPDGQRLYAVDRERTVFMFDAALQRVTASVSVNKGTSHLAVHPRSGRVYVCERSTDSMVRLDAETLQTRGRIATGESPNLPAAAANGSVVILPGRNGILTVAYDDEEVRRVNLAIGGQPSASTISHDGRRAYVPDTARNLLVTVDLEQGSVLAIGRIGLNGQRHNPARRTALFAARRWCCARRTRARRPGRSSGAVRVTLSARRLYRCKVHVRRLPQRLSEKDWTSPEIDRKASIRVPKEARMYTRILVPLDGSATAEAVLPYAQAFAAGFTASVELMSVIDIGAMTTHLSADKVPHFNAIIATEEKNSAGYLEDVAKNFFSRFPTECRIVRGNPAETILETTSKDRDTLVAMGTHGHSGAKRWLLGSVAEKVLRGTTNPLFLVRAAAAKTTPQRIINSIVVPLDGSSLAEQILPTVSNWTQALDVEVTLIRAFEFPASAYYGSEEDLPHYQTFREEARKEAAAYLKQKAESLVGQGVRTLSTVTLERPAAAEIISYARTAPRAVIAMSTHGRSGVRRWILGSVTEKVVRHGDDPVLIVRAGEKTTA